MQIQVVNVHFLQIDAIGIIIAHMFCFTKSDLRGGRLLKRPSSVSHPLHGGIQLPPGGSLKIHSLEAGSATYGRSKMEGKRGRV